jgi:hypothetical protein
LEFAHGTEEVGQTRQRARSSFLTYEQAHRDAPAARHAGGQAVNADYEQELDQIYEAAGHEAALEAGILDVITR